MKREERKQISPIRLPFAIFIRSAVCATCKRYEVVVDVLSEPRAECVESNISSTDRQQKKKVKEEKKRTKERK